MRQQQGERGEGGRMAVAGARRWAALQSGLAVEPPNCPPACFSPPPTTHLEGDGHALVAAAQRTQHGVHHAGHGWDEMLQAGGRQQAQLSSQLLLQAGGGSGHSMACQGIA